MNQQEIKNILLENKLSVKTIETYIVGFSAVCSLAGLSINTNTLLDTDKVSESINRKEKLSTRKTYFETCNSIAKYCKLPENIQAFYKQQCKILRDEDKKKLINKPTEQDLEVNEYFNYEDIAIKRDELRQELPDELNNVWFQWILCCLYSRIPPLRCGEFYTVKLNEYIVDVDNYIDLEEKTLIINEHKTKSSFSSKVIELSDELIDEIKLFNSKTNSDYLLPKITDRNEPCDRYNVRYFLNMCFGEHVSSTTIRNVYVSTVAKNKSAEERIETANTMGHTLQTQLKYYSKFDDTLFPEMKKENNVEQDILNKIQIDTELINLINVSFVNGILTISKK